MRLIGSGICDTNIDWITYEKSKVNEFGLIYDVSYVSKIVSGVTSLSKNKKTWWGHPIKNVDALLKFLIEGYCGKFLIFLLSKENFVFFLKRP